MSVEKIQYVSYEEAVQIVGAIQEEEDIEKSNKRILTVYGKDNKELCWFDFEELMADLGEVGAGEKREAVQSYVLNHIPTWIHQP